MRSLLLFSIFLYGSVISNAQIVINGKVIDALSETKLEFASVGLSGFPIGTVTNAQGLFAIQVPQQLMGDTLLVNYLGYLPFKKAIVEIESNIEVKLIPKAVQLEDVVILPRPPTYYIKEAIKRLDVNYAKLPFESLSYYREKIEENGEFVKYTEAAIKTYYPKYQDTISNQHQLYLFRQAENLQEMQFMKSKRERIAIKSEGSKKTSDNNDADENSAVTAQFGGPENIFSLDVIKDPSGFLDSNMFRKYRYEFGGARYSMGREVMIIKFRSKGSVDKLKQSGSIYLDIESYAIHAIEFKGDLKIPAWVSPILLIMGIGIKNPTFNAWSRYKMVGDRWYPEYFHWKFNTTMVKRYKFKRNESSVFEIEQMFNVSSLNIEHPIAVNNAKRLKVKESMSDQVFNDLDLTWEGVNIIK